MVVTGEKERGRMGEEGKGRQTDSDKGQLISGVLSTQCNVHMTYYRILPSKLAQCY